MDNINIGLRSYTIILLISTLSLIAGSNINCNGKAFHCVNSTHFKICVDLGGGVSTTVDEFLIPCPQNTVCEQYNLFECEYELTTTLPPVTIQSEVTNEQFKNIDSSVREQLDITTLSPTKQQEGMELSEKYYNKVNATPTSFMESLLTDAVIDSVNTSNANYLHTSSKGDIHKTLNSSRSTDKELTSITESGIEATQTSPYNINTLVTDIGVSRKYNTETPVLFSTSQDRRTIDSFKNESMEPLNQNSSDLDASYIVTKRYSAVTLLPGNFSVPSLQENTSGISNINHLIKSDNTSQDNLDMLIKYNSTQLNNSDNNTQYRNINNSMYSKNTSTEINTLNTTPFNVITDEIFTSGVSDINKKSKVNSVITLKSSRQHLAEITTTSSIIIPGTTNQFSSHISFNTEVIETFFNDGLNITTNLEKISVSDGDIMTSTSFIPETTVAKMNDTSSQITKFGISSVALTKPVLDKKNATSSKPQTSDTKSSKLRSDSEILNLKNVFEVNFTTKLNSVNNSQYLTTTEPYFHDKSDVPMSSTSKSEVTSPIHISEVLPFRPKEAIQVYNASQINNVNTKENELVSTKTPEILSNSISLPRSNYLLFTTAATKTATNDKTIVGDYSFTRVDMLPVLTTADMSNGTTSLKPLPGLISVNKPSPESVIVIGATGLVNNNITITKESYDITGEISKGLTSLKSISDLNLKNETSPKPVIVTVATDLDNNNITITEVSNNIKAELSNGVTNLKPISNLISKNETRPKSSMVIVATDLDNINITTTEESNNITAELSTGVKGLKPISVSISKNETQPKPVRVQVTTDLDNNNITTTEESNNVTGEISKGITSLTPISVLISKNETQLKPVMLTVTTDLDNNNITITEESNNITGEISNGVTSFKPVLDLISNNETSSKSVTVIVATDLDNNNMTATEESNNITAELTNRVTSFKPIPDLISNKETRPKPVMVRVATDLDNNNITTKEESNNITAELSNGVTSFKPISDLISKNETWPKPAMVTVATDIDNNNITTTEESYNITAELYNGVTSPKPISDLISKNETWPKPVMVRVATDLDNNNITTKEESNNITAELSNGVTSLKPISDLISKNETWPKPAMVTVATDLDNNNITTKEESNNKTTEFSNGVTRLKSISDLISKNETWPKPAMVTVASDLDNNNITIKEESNNKTTEFSNGVTRLKSISDLIPIPSKTQPTDFKLLTINDAFVSFQKEHILKTTSTIFTDHQSLYETTTSLSSPNNILTKDFNKDSVRLIASTDSVISNLERNTTWILTNLPSTLDKPITLTDRSSGVLDNNNTTNNNDTIKPIINSLYEINKPLSSNYTYNDNNNRTSDVYQTTTKSDRGLNTVLSLTGPAVFESPNSMNVTNNSFIVIDVLSEHRVVSDNYKNIENATKLESKITTKPSTYFDSNKISIHNISSDTKNVTSLSSQYAKNDMITKQVIYKNTSDNGKTFGKNSFGNPNSTKLNLQNILIPKIVTSNNFSSSQAFHITYINNNITDKNNNTLKDVEEKRYLVTNNFVEKLLTIGVNKTDLNYTDKNVVPSVSNNFKSVPLIYLHNSHTKPPLTNIYNVSHSENISQTLTVNKTIASNKNHETDDKESSLTNKNGLVPSHAVSIIEHERNKTKYLLLNLYTQVNTTAIKVNTTTLKELTYNISEPSFTVRNNVKHDFIMKNITTSADKNTAPKDFYDTKDSGYDKSNSTTTIKSVNTNSCTNCSKLADNSQLSAISNRQLSGNVIKPLLIKPLQDVKNTSTLHPKNGNLYSINILNNWGVVNTTLVANDTKLTKFFTQGNVSEVNSLTFIRTTEKYTNELNATSVSNMIAKDLLRNTSSQTNTIKNKTQDGMSSNGLKYSRIPSEFYKSSQSTGPLKLENTAFVSNRPTLEIISEQEKITISDHTNRSNGIEKKQLTNGQGHSESKLTIANGITKNIRNNTQTSFITPINNINYPDKHYGNLPTNQEFRCTKRGKFSDAKDCNKFFVCIGRVQPIIGLCPTDSVFSEYLKQCTKNVTHCIRNNQFKCTATGRFINILYNNTYFICAKKNSSFIRYTFQCQKGYYLDKSNIKCTPKLKNVSKSDESSSKNTKELSSKSEEMEGVSINIKNVFECEKEGKFKDPQDCRKYYVCTKGRKSVYRRKIKQCDSDEVFHRKKKKCVDVESYKCNI